MFSIAGLGFVLQRQQNPLNILFATAFMMLLANPMWLFAVGFQLSFVAVLSLIVFYRPVYRVVHVQNLILRRIWQTAAASIAAEILVAPIIIYYFHLLPAMFLVANVIAYLFLAVGLVAGMLLILLGKITFIAKGLGLLLGLMVQVLNKVIRALQGLNPPSFEHLYLNLPQLIILYVVIACFALFLLRKSKTGLLAGLGATALLLLLLTVDKVKAESQLQFIVYNMSGENYAEVIAGSKFIPILADSVNSSKRKEYARREMHIASGAWQEQEGTNGEVVSIGNKNILILDKPIAQLRGGLPAFDYVLINSPLGQFDIARIKEVFAQNRLVIGSKQKRYIAERWKDSCLKYDIPAHFTQLDGAFVIKQ
jgi:competence protein ComEC